MSLRVSDVIAEALARAGTQYLFGLAGSTIIAVLDSVARRTDIRYISVRHEQAAVSMAEGVARASGVPGVIITHSGGGVLNTAMAMASAYKDSVPLIALAAAQPQQMIGRESWHEVNTHEMFKPIVKWSASVEQPATIGRVMRNAFQIAVSGRPGPVQVEVPENLLSVQVGDAVLDQLGDLADPTGGPIRVPRFRPAPDTRSLKHALHVLLEAERPLVFLGGGTVWSDASDELLAMVEALGAPVVTTYCGRGAIPDSHPQNISYVVRGNPPSWMGGYVAFEAMRESDVILAVGARLSDISTRHWTAIRSDTQIIQVDICEQQIGFQYPVAVGIQADARQFATAFVESWSGAGSERYPEFRARAKELRDAYLKERARYFRYDHNATEIQPQQIIEELQARIDKDTIQVLGSGRHTQHGKKLWVERPRTFINSVSLGTMGQSFPAAIGAKLARPDRNVVCLTGDGDYAMVMAELETAVREHAHVTTVIFNDFAYGAIKSLQAATHSGRVAGVDHGNPDFGAVAATFGAQGFTVDRRADLGSTLEKALSTDRPSVVDIRVDQSTYHVR